MSVQSLIRIMGAGMVLGAGLLIGRHYAQSLFARVRILEDLRALVERLATQIAYQASPLREAFSEVAISSGPECREFLNKVGATFEALDGGPASGAWSAGVAFLLDSGRLTVGDAEVLDLLGPSLGTSSREEQVRHLESTVSRLSVQIEHARRESLRFDTFYRQMGVLVAAAIVLLLL